jgi:hypothetical protein
MSKFVMPGLVPGIHVLGRRKKDVDGRDKPGHDEKRKGSIRDTNRQPCPKITLGLKQSQGRRSAGGLP